MLEKTLSISGRDVTFRASAAIPRLYRMKFGRDIFRDLTKLESAYQNRSDEDEPEEFQVRDLELFENVAYVMALHGDPETPKEIDEWLDQFEMFSIYEILPEILSLWGKNMVKDVSAKKNSVRRTGR